MNSWSFMKTSFCLRLRSKRKVIICGLIVCFRAAIIGVCPWNQASVHHRRWCQLLLGGADASEMHLSLGGGRDERAEPHLACYVQHARWRRSACPRTVRERFDWAPTPYDSSISARKSALAALASLEAWLAGKFPLTALASTMAGLAGKSTLAALVE